jgi:hypothetical protein
VLPRIECVLEYVELFFSKHPSQLQSWIYEELKNTFDYDPYSTMDSQTYIVPNFHDTCTRLRAQEEKLYRDRVQLMLQLLDCHSLRPTVEHLAKELSRLTTECEVFQHSEPYTQFMFKKNMIQLLKYEENEYAKRMEAIEEKSQHMLYKECGTVVRQALRNGKSEIKYQDQNVRWKIDDISVGPHTTFEEVLRNRLLSEDKEVSYMSWTREDTWVHEYTFAQGRIQVSLQRIIKCKETFCKCIAVIRKNHFQGK